MCVKAFSSAPDGLRDWDTAEFRAEDCDESSLRLLPARTGNIPGNPGALISVDPFTLFESCARCVEVDPYNA